MQIVYDIYCIYNKVNSKRYVGQTKRGFVKRFSEHTARQNACPLLRKAVSKYGKENFQIELLDTAHSPQEANAKEKMYIFLLKTYNKCYGYNLTMGGDIGSFNKETLLKMSESKQGIKNSFYGKKHTIESKQKMSNWKKENYKLEKHPNAKRVKCVELNKIYNCAKIAAIEFKTTSGKIGQVANGRYGRKTAGGYKWIWV